MLIMADKNESTKFLDVIIELDPRRVAIGFRNNEQAAQYKRLISAKSSTQKLKLDPQRHGRLVSVRLPSRVIQLEASTTYNGFILCTNDAHFAKQWKDALMLWDFTSGSRYNLYFKRDIVAKDLNALLHIDEYIHNPIMREPGRAQNSRI
ncbi:hypothetical protein F4803DRAFT_527105 [Xylaria telfairii]|nr:hypothetical protein F4803DRAFT_527105 [Xylaria telfairii]